MNVKLFDSARERYGLSLRALARRVGVSHAAVVFWRQGKVSPRMEHARKVADLLNVDFGDLWGGP